MTFQKEIIIGPYKRGFHIITNKIVNELPAGLLSPAMVNFIEGKIRKFLDI